jgi:hypothetical protein
MTEHETVPMRWVHDGATGEVRAVPLSADEVAARTAQAAAAAERRAARAAATATAAAQVAADHQTVLAVMSGQTPPNPDAAAALARILGSPQQP